MIIVRKTYYGASVKFPVTITQRFWDKVTNRRKQIEEYNKTSTSFPRIDTSYGDIGLGKRPTIPDIVYDVSKVILYLISFLCFLFMMDVFIRGY